MSTHGCGHVARQASLAVGLALAFIASPALSQKADRPEVKVGDEWQFVTYLGVPPAKPNIVWVVTSITPAGIEGTENGKPLMLTQDLNVAESPLFRFSERRLLSFPLEVGRKWTVRNNVYDKSLEAKRIEDLNVTVVGRERVRVLAGEFDAFKIEARGKVGVEGAAGAGGREISYTYWYAPSARAIVKQETADRYHGPSAMELVSFKLLP